MMYRPHSLAHLISTGTRFSLCSSITSSALSIAISLSFFWSMCRSLIHWRLWLARVTTLFPTLPFSPFSSLFTLWTPLCRLSNACGEMTKTQGSLAAPCGAFGEQRLSASFLQTYFNAFSQRGQRRALKRLSEMPLTFMKTKVCLLFTWWWRQLYQNLLASGTDTA